MTMSMTLVNTSNWDNEYYEITSPDNGMYGASVVEQILLKPGEQCIIYPSEEGSTFTIKAMHKDEKPFYVPALKGNKREDRQVMPRVRVEFS